MHFLIKQTSKAIFIASALQRTATTSLPFFLHYNAIFFSKYSRSFSHSQFIPTLCINCTQEAHYVQPYYTHFGAGGCVTCTLRTQRFLPAAQSTRHTPAPTSHPSSSQAWVISCTDIPLPRWAPTCCTQLTGVTYGLLEQPNPAQGDREQERGHSPMFFLRIFQMVTLFLLLSPITQPTDVV